MATLKLRDNNLYQGPVGSLITYENGEEELIRTPVEYPPAQGDRYYIVQTGDQLDLITWLHYKDYAADSSKLWWFIADANKIENPLDISDWVGKELLIPDYYTFRLKL